MRELDPRIVRVDVQVGSGIKTYEGIAIAIQGTKYANSLQNEAEVTLVNLNKATQDRILTETSPYTPDRTPKSVIVYAGRRSYGVAKIYEGNIANSNVTQPPDIGVILKCLTGNFLKGNILARNFQTVTLRQVSTQVAQDLNKVLHFQAADKTISNYAYSGSALKQVDYLSATGGVNVFINDSILVVKDAWTPYDENSPARILSAETGMIGIPEFTEQGVKVKFLIDNKTTIGSRLIIDSKIYPATNGEYIIYKLGFQIANRDTPFYYIAEAARRRPAT